jgi:hypothetical protein
LFACAKVEPVIVLVAALLTWWANYREDCESFARRQQSELSASAAKRE